MLRVPYALSVYDKKEIDAVLKVLVEHRTNMGTETAQFENTVAKIIGKKFGVMVNSGSSANLLAIELLDLPKGSEIITPLLTFSTTISPLIKHGLIPVFVDVVPGKYIIDVSQIERVITSKTKVLMVPLLLGNVPEMEKLQKIAKKYKLFLIEDSCDTLGATYKGKPTGTYTDITTTSFFGSHIITAGGNGGMLLVNDKKYFNRAKVLRGWGRNSSLFEESENLEKRFKTKINGSPYDAKFIFDEIGYNFLPNEMGAAFGNEQLKKLSVFRKTREKNFSALLTFFQTYKTYFTLPIQDPLASTQWLAFPLTITPNAPFKRIELVKYLEKNNIQTRPIFTGNILQQPGFKRIKHKGSGKYPITNAIMERGLIIGCHQGLTEKHLDYVKQAFSRFLKNHT